MILGYLWFDRRWWDSFRSQMLLHHTEILMQPCSAQFSLPRSSTGNKRQVRKDNCPHLHSRVYAMSRTLKYWYEVQFSIHRPAHINGRLTLQLKLSPKQRSQLQNNESGILENLQEQSAEKFYGWRRGRNQGAGMYCDFAMVFAAFPFCF